MSVGRKQIKTKTLNLKVEEALRRLLPLFEVSKEELSKFRKPVIRRHLNGDEYPEHSRKILAYSSIDNFLYFPQKNTWYETMDMFSMASVQHEVAHYIHHQINEEMTNELRRWLLNETLPKGIHQLGELVAEYPNMVLNMRDYSRYPLDPIFKTSKHVFDKFGPGLLPKLSRMSLNETIERGLVDPRLNGAPTDIEFAEFTKNLETKYKK